ncbi:patched domain-containing protein 3 [Malaclemys terrapin pileata]|uniref:patched domain-containing protein 3 n=1 Tax=Malaclemys terrapin pileata TaxID=2991368 RepID=UPI0023A8C878|nr:patched domain-containing protein 3 [Malaclemys terrapin pileata]
MGHEEPGAKAGTQQQRRGSGHMGSELDPEPGPGPKPTIPPHDNFALFLSRRFGRLGGLIGAHPWPFLLLPLLLSGGLGAGFLFLPQRQANDIEGQFTPLGGPAKSERRFAQEHFPTRDSERFSGQRLLTEGAFASLIAVSASGNNILTAGAFGELLRLDGAVQSLAVPGGDPGTQLSYPDLCVRSNGSCGSPNPLLAAVQGEPARLETLLPQLTYPVFGSSVFMGTFLGGVQLAGGAGASRVQAAKALRLVYYLREDEAADRERSLQWLENFLKRIPAELEALNLTSVQVAYFTSISRQEEFEGNIRKVIPLFSITYFLTITFAITSCLRVDCVRNKVWVAAFGVLSSGLAVLSSFGLLLFCGVPFVLTVANAPFLILGVGVDDMFIMISSWQQTNPKNKVEKRMAETYAEAAVSITITTLTDVLAFYIGIMTSFQSVKSFCLYTGTAFIFCYIYNITFFGAVLALNGKREEGNRHWLIFTKVKDIVQPHRSYLYNMCCVGGFSDKSSVGEDEHPMNKFFRKYYGPFLTKIWTKVFVVLLYGGFLASSIYGCTQIKEGIDLRNLASDDSYVVQYYDWEDEYFSEYGPRIMVTITENVPYWNLSIRNDIENCMESLENNSYVDRNLSESWLRMYANVARIGSLNIDTKAFFMGNLSELFKLFPEFEWDIDIRYKEIAASRFFIQTVNVTTAVDEKNLLHQLRDLAKDCKIPLMVYHPAFIYYDQYIVIVPNTIQNVGIASGVMLCVSLLLIPNLLCSLWVTFAIASVIVGVAGFMTYWDVNLDSISMINLVICIGFSVDFSAHISYAFVSSEKSTVNEKAVDALYLLGYPVIQGAISTILGVIVLSAAQTYIFRTFFKIMFLVILFGAVHGLVFIPVFLTFFGICGRSANKRVNIKTIGENSNSFSNSQNPNNVGCYENQIYSNGDNFLEDNTIRQPNDIGMEKPNSGYLRSNFFPVSQNHDSSSCLYQNNAVMVYKKQIKQLHDEGKINPDCP